jgi:photosystem II stability/assembly factor-like uncharacterized protein
MNIVRFFLLLFLGLALAACETPTEPGSDAPGETTVTMTNLTDLPMIGGDATGIAITPSNTIIAVIDGKLYSMNPSGGSRQLINGDAVHWAMGLAPSGEVYTVTATHLRTYDLAAGTHREVPIDPAGPFALGRRIEGVEIIFSPSGEPYIKLINNTPQTYVYYSTDKGASWKGLSMPPGFQYAGGLAFAPNGDLLMSSTFGFYRSTDRGATWTTYPSPRPGYGGTLFTASNGDIYHYPGGGGGLKVSRNGGASFTELTPFNQAPYFTALQQGPDGALYALANRTGAGYDLIRRPTSFLRSTDGGATWKQVMYAQGRTFAMRGSLVVIGLGMADEQHGGLLISEDAGVTWRPDGIEPVKQVSDMGFDRDGNLMILADNGLYRKTGSGWQALGTQPGLFGRFASTPQGGLLIVNTTSTFYSSDNGATWKESLIEGNVYPGTGSPGIPALVGRKNGEFIFSLTFYSDANGHTNGYLFRVGPDGKANMVTGFPYTLSSIVEDNNGILYASQQVLDPMSVTFYSRSFQSNDGVTWTEQQGLRFGMAYNSQNRYLGHGEMGSLLLKKTGEDGETKLKLNGFTSQSHYITRSKFGADDRLYLITLDKGLFISNGPVR